MNTLPNEDPLLITARQYITTVSLQYQDPRLMLYDDRLAFYLENLVMQFGEQMAIAAEELKVAQLASLFYPLGLRIDQKKPLEAAQENCLAFFKAQQAENALLSAVNKCLEECYQQRPQQQSSKLVMDALIAIHCNDGLHNWADLRQLEDELLNGPRDRQTQAQLRLQELLNLRFFTSPGKAHWQIMIGQELVSQKKKLEKLNRSQTTQESPAGGGPFQALESQIPIRGAQTYFRAVYRNHINLSAIADNKANIMISVNSILISVLITFLSYRNIAETQPMILLPVVIFLVSGLASLVFAVLSARPKVTRLNNEKAENSTPSGLAFFGNFVHLPVEVFTKAMDETLQSSSLLYDSMVKDLYYLGRVLDKKYRFLSISYNIFMVGLIITVGLFLFTLFAS